MFRRLLRRLRQLFDLFSHKPCVRLGQLFPRCHHMCYVLRANHRVMGRTSTPLVNVLRAILTHPIENWTSATTHILRNMLGPSPPQWQRSNLPMFVVGSPMYSTGLPLRSGCDMVTHLYIMRESHVSQHPKLVFTPRHVPLTHEGMRMWSESPLFTYPQPVPQLRPPGSRSPPAIRKYRPSCPSKFKNQPKIPSLAVNPPRKIICGCCSMRESRADLVAKTAITS